jgi:hypothetical protein
VARAMQCPSCGTTNRIDGSGGSRFRCEECGQVLRMPPSATRTGGRAPRPTGNPTPMTVSSDGGPGSIASDPSAPPAPRRRRPVMTAGSGAGGGTAVLSAAEEAPPPVVVPPRPTAPVPEPMRRDGLPFPFRILAWVLAVPIGLAAVGIPARKGGYLTSQKLLDVIVKHSMSRFVPLAVIVLLWALVTAVLVTAFIEGGRFWWNRRKRRKAAARA